MTKRFPNYDVLDRRRTLSWNEPTRRAIDRRLAVHPGPRFFSDAEWRTLRAVCARILPQPTDRPTVPLPAYVDEKMFDDVLDGFRDARLPAQGNAWKTGLAAFDAVARERHDRDFHDISPADQDALLTAAQNGELAGAEWRGMPSDIFFAKRVLHDVVGAYYAHPTAWSEIGWAGPASPRGFVRLDADTRDPWEAAEAYPGEEADAARANARIV